MARKIKQYTVTVVVLSYNRPKMLQETLASIKNADEVIIVDDGSDFDIGSVVKKYKFPRFSLIGAPRITLEERLKTQRIADLINEALKQARGDIISYICDDDLMTKEWIPALKKFYAEHGEKYHLVRGNCLRFMDENDLGVEERSKHLMVFADSPRQLITGNFAHLRKCFKKEKVKWPGGFIVGHDTAFFNNMDKVHDTWTVPLIPVNAVFRRIHDKMLSNHVFYNDDQSVSLGEFSESAKDMLRKNQFLE